MKKIIFSKEGSLTIDATITLTFFLFAVLFFMNFGAIFRAQNYVQHGLLQTSKFVSYMSYQYELYDGSSDFVNSVFSLKDIISDIVPGDVPNDIRKYYKDGNVSEMLEAAWIYCCSSNNNTWMENKEKYRISGITFEDSVVDAESILINAQYEIDLPFAFFGFKQAALSEQVKSAKWGHE